MIALSLVERLVINSLHQGKRSAADFVIEFQTLATTCEWNELALTARFLDGLSDKLKDEIFA